MEGYPRTVQEFEEKYSTEQSCIDYLLPLANRVIALLKRWLLGTHQGAVQISHPDYYLDEFTFRFNCRTSRSRGKLFYRLVQQAISIEPVTGNSIIGGVQHNI